MEQQNTYSKDPKQDIALMELEIEISKNKIKIDQNKLDIYKLKQQVKESTDKLMVTKERIVSELNKIFENVLLTEQEVTQFFSPPIMNQFHFSIDKKQIEINLSDLYF